MSNLKFQGNIRISEYQSKKKGQRLKTEGATFIRHSRDYYNSLCKFGTKQKQITNLHRNHHILKLQGFARKPFIKICINVSRWLFVT